MYERKTLFPFGLYHLDSWNFDPFKKDLLKLCTKNQDKHFDSFFRAYESLKSLIFRKASNDDQKFWFVFGFNAEYVIYFDSSRYNPLDGLPKEDLLNDLLCSSGTGIIGKFIDGVFEWCIVKNSIIKELYYDTSSESFFAGF